MVTDMNAEKDFKDKLIEAKYFLQGKKHNPSIFTCQFDCSGKKRRLGKYLKIICLSKNRKLSLAAQLVAYPFAQKSLRIGHEVSLSS